MKSAKKAGRRNGKAWHEEGTHVLVPFPKSPHGNAVGMVEGVTDRRGDTIYDIRLLAFPEVYPVAEQNMKPIASKEEFDSLLDRDRGVQI